MRILIAVPCFDQVPTQFAFSLAMLKKVEECAVSFQMGSLIYTARNDLAKKSIEMECDYVLWLDSDITFKPDLLERLWAIKDKGDIITGLYYRRVKPFSPVIFDEIHIDENGCSWSEPDEIPDGLFEAEGCGFGCVLMPTNIFIDVMAKFGALFSPIGNVGEDLSFCWRARQCGYKIVCDPTIYIGHVGHYVIDKEFYNSYKGVQNESKNQ